MLQLELRQYINDLLIKTGGAAAPGFPINSCKLYPVRCSPSLLSACAPSLGSLQRTILVVTSASPSHEKWPETALSECELPGAQSQPWLMTDITGLC